MLSPPNQLKFEAYDYYILNNNINSLNLTIYIYLNE